MGVYDGLRHRYRREVERHAVAARRRADAAAQRLEGHII